MGQLVSFQFEEDETLHFIVIENQVDVKIIRIGRYMLLPFHESEATAQLHDKFLKVVNQGLFQFRFGKGSVSPETHEFGYHRVFQVLQRVGLSGMRGGEGGAFPLGGESAFEVLGGDVSV